MAEEEAKEEEKEEKKEDKKEKGEKKEGGNKMLMIIVIVLLVLLLVVGGVVAMMMMGGDEEEADAPKKEATEQKVEVEKDTKPKKPMKFKETNNKDYLSVGPMYEGVGKQIVNLVSDTGRRYLKTTIVLECVDETAIPELDMKIIVIKDVVMNILASKTVDEVTSRKGKAKIKAQIVYEVNEFLEEGRIKHVFFTDFVVQ
jgi:flagellar FliL protein